jgi:hypothetical protein
MNNTNTLTLTKTNVTVFLFLLAVATLAPYTRNQFISGTIVNCTLLITTATLGIRAGLLISILPSTIALATGLLPSVLAPMIPFVILGNAVLILVFNYLKNINYWLGAVVGAAIKFGLLTGAISFVTHLIISQKIAASVSYMMSWPQLVTALAGSVVAFGILYVKNKTTTRASV